jgi:hypothetical protein
MRTTPATLRSALEKLKKRPLDPSAIREGVLRYERTGELPQAPRLREIVTGIAEFLALADWVSDGDAWNGLPPPTSQHPNGPPDT